MIDATGLAALAGHHLWQSLAIAGILALVLVAARKLSGAHRYLLAAAAFGVSALAPLAAFLPGEGALVWAIDALDAPVRLSPPTPDAVSPVLVAAPPAADPALNAPAAAAAIIDGARVATAPVVAEVQPQAAPAAAGVVLPDWLRLHLAPPLALGVWAFGAGLMLLRLLADIRAVERLVRNSRPVQLPPSLQKAFRGLRIRESEAAPGPMAAGLFNPAVILPPSVLDRMSARELRSLLEHERAHIERGDILVALGQRVLLAVFWWSPAMHWMSRRCDEEREIACDEASVSRTGDARLFAATLTREAELRMWSRAPRMAVGAMGRSSELGRRVRRLISDVQRNGVRQSWAAPVAFGALALVVLVAATLTPQLTARAQEGETANPESPEGSVRYAQAPRAPRVSPPSPVSPAPPVPPAPPVTPVELSDLSAMEERINMLAEQLESRVQRGLGESGDGRLSAADEAEIARLSTEIARLGTAIGIAASSQALRELSNELPRELDSLTRELEIEGVRLNTELRGLGVELSDVLREVDVTVAEALREANVSAELGLAAAELAGGVGGLESAMRLADTAQRDAMEAQRRAMRDAAQAQRDALEANRERMRDSRHNAASWDGGDSPARQNELAKAVAEGRLDRVTALIKAGVDADTTDSRGKPLVVKAVEMGRTDVAAALIRAGADADCGYMGRTAVSVAVDMGKEDMVRMLVENGADADDGRSLPTAVSMGREDVVRVLLENGADADDGRSLHQAVAMGRVDLVKSLLEHGADADDGRSLRQALAMNRRDIVSLLRRHGAE